MAKPATGVSLAFSLAVYGCLAAGLLLLLGGCGSSAIAPLHGSGPKPTPLPEISRAAPARPRPPAPLPSDGKHQVVKGDTLYSIAWRYRVDHKDLATWNGIRAPFTIYPGDRLRVSAPQRAKRQAQPRPQPKARAVAKAPKVGAKSPSRAVAKAKPAKPKSGRLSWRWPAKGSTRPAGAGLNILGKRGQPIRAAAGGTIVYSGSGLIGYGKLIIIKHNDDFLSAYAHNEKLLVQEGATVAGGEKIAEMGKSGAKEVMLHFEIRRDGNPVAPLDYLPKS